MWLDIVGPLVMTQMLTFGAIHLLQALNLI
jgi:hypothetical protein